MLLKIDELHPKRPSEYNESTHSDENNGENWGCGGMSEEIAAIHFSSSMTLLFKPKGKNKKSVFERLMSDWTAVEDSEWTLRPISAGNAHDRLIEEQR